MKLRFAKLNPTENMTILVLDPVPREIQPAVADKLMEYGSVHAEQVGFLEKATMPGVRARLQMMGGEFCGNASMSLAALLAYRDELPDGEERIYPLEISGADSAVHCSIRREGSACIGRVSMPVPESICEVELDPGVCLPVVRFPGIAHVVARTGGMDAASARAVIPRWCRQLNTGALGILLTDDDLSRIRPLVYVRGTDSAVWERGCGSGSAALGAYAAWQSGGSAMLDVQQPGGRICVQASWQEGRVQDIAISGRVQIAAIGEAFVDI